MVAWYTVVFTLKDRFRVGSIRFVCYFARGTHQLFSYRCTHLLRIHYCVIDSLPRRLMSYLYRSPQIFAYLFRSLYVTLFAGGCSGLEMKMGSLFSIIRLKEHDICNGLSNRYRSVAQTGAQNCGSYARALPQSDCKFASISFATRFARPPRASAAAFKSPSLGALCAKKKRLVRVSICWCNESDIKRRICCRWFLTDVRKKRRFSRSLLRMSGTTVAEK